LRAPLRGIDGFSRLLLEDSAGALDERAQDRLRRIRAAAGRMGQLIDALLDLSRLSRTELRYEQIGVSTLATHICREYERTAPGRSITWHVQPGLSATGDPRLIRVLLENLLSNAFKFTSEIPNGEIDFGCKYDKREQVFYVKDNGVGFDMQHAGQLFVPFQRLHGKPNLKEQASDWRRFTGLWGGTAAGFGRKRIPARERPSISRSRRSRRLHAIRLDFISRGRSR
jgi:signal transduction histidine kinase